jgi:hypothetical protein
VPFSFVQLCFEELAVCALVCCAFIDFMCCAARRLVYRLASTIFVKEQRVVAQRQPRMTAASPSSSIIMADWFVEGKDLHALSETSSPWPAKVRAVLEAVQILLGEPTDEASIRRALRGGDVKMNTSRILFEAQRQQQHSASGVAIMPLTSPVRQEQVDVVKREYLGAADFTEEAVQRVSLAVLQLLQWVRWVVSFHDDSLSRHSLGSRERQTAARVGRRSNSGFTETTR